ncbi:BSD domain containing protein [Trema orientale]|uniref:BSD domain containing protein n=1 Tax=Trema orientale TaxID=63057 RepID=A0A2P5DTV6_TREOI|nr:BSD domain containing protein [Trema orientale]
MEDFWKRAKGLAEEAAKKSQSLTSSAKISDLVSETAKRSRELAAEASKKADLIKTAALKQADQIKSFSSDIIVIPPQLSSLSITTAFPSSSSSSGTYVSGEVSQAELLRFGITEDLTDFVKGLTSTTFQSFTIQDEAEGSESETPTTASNVRKDLTEWQEKHATLVLTTVKHISRLRYELCPRTMKERRFWKIYFTLVSSYVAPYEKQYQEEKLKEAEQKKDDNTNQTSVVGGNDKEEGREKNLSSLSSKSSSAEQDLDTFLLGDLEDSDGGPDDGEESFDDDFDKIDNSVSSKDPDVEDEKNPKK